MSITFNGQCSDELHCVVEYYPNPVRPERRGQLIVIPGRNGAIVNEEGVFATYSQSYEVHLDARGGNLYRYSRDLAAWLLGSSGFCRLEDSYEPDVYRLARYAGPLDLQSAVLANHGRATITFEVQPQRYLKCGEAAIQVRSGKDVGGLYYGSIAVEPIPFGTKAVYVECLSGSAVCMGNYRDESGGEIGVGIYDTPVPVPDGAAEVTCGWSNASEDSVIVMGIVDANGDKTPLCGALGTSPVVFNPSQHEARPLLQFADTSIEPPVVQKTLSKVSGSYIFKDGTVHPTAWRSQTGMYTTEPVPLSGGGYAIVTGISYAFLDASGKMLKFYEATAKNAGTYLKNARVIVPDNAASVIVGGVDESGGDYNVSIAALSLQAKRQSPGAAAVTINSIAINLDFSEHDTIFLDCDLHDAYYTDGTSANNKISFESVVDPYPTFPGLAPGPNTVVVRDGANLRFSIVPRWWIL